MRSCIQPSDLSLPEDSATVAASWYKNQDLHETPRKENLVESNLGDIDGHALESS